MGVSRMRAPRLKDDFRAAWPPLTLLAGIVGGTLLLLKTLPPEQAAALERYLSILIQ
jgi:hypothetical protein